jgi:GT2 family glycosyltransferase
MNALETIITLDRPPTDIAVCVGTFGDTEPWESAARRWALPSVEAQRVPARRTTWCHGTDLQQARNTAAEDTPHAGWLCFLDADDELDPGYLEAMAAAADGLEGDWLLQPATLGIYPDGREDHHPVVIPPKHLLDGNYLVISTLIRSEQFTRIGGFGDWPIYEDWDLWIRAVIDGARIRVVPEAVLRVHVNPTGRNNGDRNTQLRVYQQIRHHYQGQL